jgi:hypothetical protein
MRQNKEAIMAAATETNRPYLKAALTAGWNFTKTSYWKMWGIFMIFFLISGFVTVIPFIIAGAGIQLAYQAMHEGDMPVLLWDIANFVASLIYFAPIFLVDFALYAGLFSTVKNGLEGKPFGLANLFDAFRKNYRKTLLVSLFVVGFLLSLLVVVFGVLGGLQTFMARAAASNFIPLFGNLLPLYYLIGCVVVFGAQAFVTYPYLLMWEEEKKVKDIVADSFRLGKKYFKPTFLYLLMFLGIIAIVAAAAAIGIGIFTVIGLLFMKAASFDSPVFMILGTVVVLAGMVFVTPLVGSWSYATCAHLYKQIRGLEK